MAKARWLCRRTAKQADSFGLNVQLKQNAYSKHLLEVNIGPRLARGPFCILLLVNPDACTQCGGFPLAHNGYAIVYSQRPAVWWLTQTHKSAVQPPYTGEVPQAPQ